MEKFYVKSNYKQIIGLCLFSFIFVFFCSKCSPLYYFNSYCDPHIYFSVGKGVFNDKVLYRDVFDHKGPLIFLLYGIAYLISNTDFNGVFLLESLSLFLTLLYVYKTGLLFLIRKKAFLLSLIFAVILFMRTGDGGSADEFIVPFITISFYYFILFYYKGDTSAKTLSKQLFIHGLLFGIVFFIKYTACLIWPALLLGVFYKLYRLRLFKSIFISSISFLEGFLLISLPIIAYFVFHSALSDFIFGYFQFNMIYASSSLGFEFYAFTNIVARFYKGIREFNVSFLIIIFGFIATLFSKKFVNDRILKLSLLFSFLPTYSILASSPAEMGYAYIILFSFSILGWISILDCLSGVFDMDKIKATLFYAISFMLFLAIGCCDKKLFNQDVDVLLRRKVYSYFQKDFARIIKTRDNPTLIDLGLDNGVFTEANLVPSFKYFFHPFIYDGKFPDIKNSEIDIVKNRKSTFVITRDPDFPCLQDNYNLVSSHKFYNEEKQIVGTMHLFERKE